MINIEDLIKREDDILNNGEAAYGKGKALAEEFKRKLPAGKIEFICYTMSSMIFHFAKERKREDRQLFIDLLKMITKKLEE